MLFAAAILLFIAVIDPVASQTMSLSLVSNSSQLFCYTVPPSLATSPIRCAFSQQYKYITPKSFAITTTAAPWSGRHDATIIVYPRQLSFTHTNGSAITLPPNSLVIITDRTTSRKIGNDVWVSADHGKSWDIVCGISTSGQKAFGEFVNTSYAPLSQPTTLYNKTSGAVWLVGGSLQFDIGPTNAVWTSTDMIHWRSVNTSETVFTPRTLAVGGIDSNGTMYLISGLTFSQSLLNDVWISVNGIVWTLIIEKAPFVARREAHFSVMQSKFVMNDILLIVGGYVMYSMPLSDVWLSNNGGRNWLQVTESAIFQPRNGFVLGVSSSNVLVIALGESRLDLWVSFDGSINWHKCSSQLPISARGYPSAVFDTDDHLIISGGARAGEFNDVWRSSISFNDTLSLATKCGLNVFVPNSPGLQCWPNTSFACSNVTGINISTAVDSMRLIPIRRHIRLPSLLHTAMQSVCGDRDKACGLTMNGTIVCWHSYDDVDAPITVSPPAYMKFTQLSCGIDPESTSMTYACAIIANVGMAGRAICWNVSGTMDDMLFLDDITYWMYAEIFQSLDIVLQQRLWEEWSRDGSTSGRSQCNAYSPQQPFPMLMNQSTYSKQKEAVIIRQITQQRLFNSISCLHWSESCILLSTDDEFVRTDHRFTQYLRQMNSSTTGDKLLQVVALNNSLFQTSISARLSVFNESHISIDEATTRSVLGSWSHVVSPQFFEQFDDGSSGLLCGIQKYPNTGHVACNKPFSTAMSALEPVPLRQVSLGVSSLSITTSSTGGGLCGQRMNDSQWQCYPSSLPEAINSVKMSAVIPISTGILPEMMSLITRQASWSSRIEAVTIVYPLPLIFNHTNGTVIVLQANSLVMTSYWMVSGPVGNDVWTSPDNGKTYVIIEYWWYLIAGVTTNTSQRAYGIAANTSFSPRYYLTPLFNKTSGQVWLLGGSTSTSYLYGTNDVFTSTDMIHWDQHNATFTPRHAAVSGMDSKGNMYFGTGCSIRNMLLRDFYVSRDAINWTIRCSQCEFEPRYLAQLSIVKSAAVLNLDILTLVGGYIPGIQYNNDVWLSSDGAVTWHRVTTAASFSGRNRFVLDVTPSNTLILAMGNAPPTVVNDLWMSFDGSVTWNKCNANMPIAGRISPGWVFDSDNHWMIFGGFNPQYLNDVWRSVIPFNDSVLLARWCMGMNQSNIIVPTEPGLQCWPPNSNCLIHNVTVVNSSFTGSEDYSLVISILDKESSMDDHATLVSSSNLYIWNSFLIDIQTNNFNLWRTGSGNAYTVFSSTIWSPLLVTNQPTSNTQYTQISSTYDYACALSSNGSVICWGSHEWYVAWPRCYKKEKVCLIYGNLCTSSSVCSNTSPSLTRPYSTFNAPAAFEPYVDMCTTPAYACAISGSAMANHTIICWMGIYGNGSRLVRWNDTVDGNTANCGSRLNGMSACSAAMSNDSAAFDNEQFTSIRCSQFSLCGLTVNGSILCSSIPIYDDSETEDMIIKQNDIPFVHIGQSNNNELCGILSNGSIRCSLSSTERLGRIDTRLPYDADALALPHWYRVGGGTNMLLCSNGSYSDRIGSLTSLCSGPCMAGHFGTDNSSALDHLVNATCLGQCPQGNWCPSGTVVPMPCSRGRYNAGFGLTASTQCKECIGAGEYCPGGNIAPYLCPRGAFCPDASNYKPCPAGRYGDVFGLDNATCSGECAQGYMCSEYSVSPTQQPCPSGQHNNATGKASCDLCPAGSFALLNQTIGTVNCTSCPPGKYSPADGASMCLPCPVGQYNNMSSQSFCVNCPAGTQSENVQSGDVRCIPCGVGFHSPEPGSQVCLQCSVSTYNLLEGSVICQSCQHIDGATCTSGIATIDNAYHASIQISRAVNGTINISLITQPCPDGYCTGTNTTQLDHIAIVEYQNSERNETIYLSLLNQCKGGTSRDQSAFSPLCSKCEAGFAPADVGSPSMDCVLCDGVSWLKLSLMLGVSWLFVLVYYVASNGRLGLIGTLLYYFQTIAIMVSSQSSLTAWLRTFFSPVSIMPNECLGQLSPELQYAIPLTIAPLQLLQLFIIVMLHAVLKRYSTPSTYKLDPVTMTYVMTMAESVQYSREIHFPFLQWWTSFIRYRLWPELTVSTVCRCIFLIMTASFTSVMLTCISWFQCTRDIEVGPSRISGSVVFAFPAISCQSSSYYAWSFVMGGTIMIWLLIIALLSWWLIINRRQFAVLQQRSSVSTVSLTVVDQKPLAALVPIALIPHARDKQALSALFVPFVERTGFGPYWPVTVEDEQDWDEPVCDADDCMETRREYAFRSVYGAIYDSFTPNATGWTIMILVRRLVLILLSVMLTAYPAIKHTLFTLLHLTICGLHLHYQPYTTGRLNQIEKIAIVVHIVVAVFLANNSTPNDLILQSAILTVALIPLITYPLWHYAQTQFRCRIIKSIPSKFDTSVNDLGTRLLPEPIEMECKRRY